VGHVACAGQRRGAYSILVGNPEKKNSTNSTEWVKWKDNVKMDIHVLG
jgi:hypothetical protein